MSPLVTRFELTWLALAGSYLWHKRQQRLRNWTPPEDPEKWTGHGIDVSELKSRVEDVRRDYLVSRHTAGVAFHRSLLEWARRVVMQLGYFRHKEADDHGP
jgi:hypothetical protein